MRPEPDALRRRRTFLAGHRAETLALLWLTLKGYRLLARRYKVHGGEIDLVMRHGETVVFVEVKARPTLAQAMEALGPAQARRIDRAAAVWLARNPEAIAMVLRGDLLAVAPWSWPRHLPGAIPLATGR